MKGLGIFFTLQSKLNVLLHFNSNILLEEFNLMDLCGDLRSFALFYPGSRLLSIILIRLSNLKLFCSHSKIYRYGR